MRLRRLAASAKAVLVAACASWATASVGATFEVKAVGEPRRAVILATGPIAAGDVARLRKATREARRVAGSPPLLVLDSPGGHLLEGIALGRAVRADGMATALMPGGYCASACSLAFFGGFDKATGRPDRTVYGSGRIGVHHWRQTLKFHGWVVTGKTSAADLQTNERLLDTFAEDMGVSPEIRRRARDTPNEQIYFLTMADMSGSEIGQRSRLPADLQDIAAAIRKFPCDLKCVLRMAIPQGSATWLKSPLASVGADAGERPISGEAYLASWTTLGWKSVRIDSCTLWQPVGLPLACVFPDRDGRTGFVVLAHSTWGPRGASWLWRRCSTPSPVEACRVALAGFVRPTPQGPVLVDPYVQPLSIADATAPACGLDCVAKKRADLAARAAATTEASRPKPPDRRMTGAAFLQGSSKLINVRIDIIECTIWLPDAAEAPCVVREDGRQLGFVVLTATDFAGSWDAIRTRCATAEPSDVCRATVSGVVAGTPHGLVLKRASVRFLEQPTVESRPMQAATPATFQGVAASTPPAMAAPATIATPGP